MTDFVFLEDSDIATPFCDAVAWKPSDESVWTGAVSEDWFQGRTAYGGYVIAGAVGALQAVAGDRPVRKVSAALMDRLDCGAFDARVSVLRQGRQVAFAECRVQQGETHAATILAAFGSARETTSFEAPDRPDVPEVESISSQPYIPGVMPACVQQFEFRHTQGGIPFSGTEGRSLGGWLRLRHAGEDATLAAVAMLDAFPFPFMQEMTTPVPVTSIMITVHLFDLNGADPAGWWYLSSDTVKVEDGYGTFTTRLYRPDGTLGAWAEQLVGVYGAPPTP